MRGRLGLNSSMRSSAVAAASLSPSLAETVGIGECHIEIARFAQHPLEQLILLRQRGARS